MVGIVIVSHHAKLAEGLRDLAEQMVSEPMPIAIAGGIDDPENPFGTDAIKVSAAIESVYSPDGVVLLMDLGSALLSAETALEFLSPEQRANVGHSVHRIPNESMGPAAAAGQQRFRKSNYRGILVDGPCDRAVSAERAQVPHHASHM